MSVANKKEDCATVKSKPLTEPNDMLRCCTVLAKEAASLSSCEVCIMCTIVCAHPMICLYNVMHFTSTDRE